MINVKHKPTLRNPCATFLFNTVVTLLVFFGFQSPSVFAQDPNVSLHLETARQLSDSAVRSQNEVRDSIDNYPILLLEGDSWFDLPWPHTDVADRLKNLNYAVVSLATHGDTLENMAFNGQLQELVAQFRNLIRQERFPTAILLSSGGNDIVGHSLKVILNHSSSSASKTTSNGNIEEVPWQTIILDRTLERFQSNTVDFLAAISILCQTLSAEEAFRQQEMQCNNIPIIIHGYAYPLASGQGFRYFWIFNEAGPWIEPSFTIKGYDRRRADSMMHRFVDEYNDKLSNAVELLGNMDEIENPICYINLRDVVKQHQWADELHPNSSAMDGIAKSFHNLIINWRNRCNDDMRDQSWCVC